MKITIISHAAGTPKIGPNLRTYYLATYLKKLNHSVNVIGASNFHKYHTTPLEYYKKLDIVIEGVKYTWLKTPKYNGRFMQVVNQLTFSILLPFKIKIIKK